MLNREPNAATHIAEQIDHFKRLGAQVDEELHAGEKLAQEALALAHSEEEQKEFERVDQTLKRIEKEHVQYSRHVKEIFDLIAQGKLSEAEATAQQAEQEEEELNKELEELLVEIGAFTEQAAKRAEENERHTEIVIAALYLLALAAGGGLGWMIVRTTKGRLDEIAVPMRKMRDQLVMMVSTSTPRPCSLVPQQRRCL